jgi:hypothetical protein
VIRDVVRFKPPQKWGLLCIDIWDVDGSNDDFYRTALERLTGYDITAVVNCTMDIELSYADVSVYGTLKKYHWQPVVPDSQMNNVVLLDLIRAAGTQRTSKIIHDNLFDTNTVHLSSRSAFMHHVNYTVPDVQDWIILGSAWKVCLHIGPLGVNTLVDIPAHKFYMFPEWSIQNENRTRVIEQQIHDDFLVWAPVDNGGYRLITRASNHKWAETNAGNF